MKLTLNQKVLSGFIVCVIVVIIVAAFSLKNSEKVVRTNRAISHSQELLYEFEQTFAASINMQTGIRGFIITGNERFLEPYESSRGLIHKHLEALMSLTTGNAPQQKNVELLRKEVDDLLMYQENLIEARKRSYDEARAIVSSGEGKTRQDDIRQIVRNAKTLENEALSQLKKEGDQDARNFNNLLIILLIVIVTVLGCMYAIIHLNSRALRKAEKVSDEKNWLLTGSFELNEKTQREQTANAIAKAVIEHLCNYLKAQIGVIYLSENGQLVLAGSYAFHVRKQNASVVQFGEGLVGQAAAEKKTIIFTDVPDDYIKINSGLGNSTPKNIAVIPLLLDNSVKGVIEIGTHLEFTALEMQFLNITAVNIAIVISAAQAKDKLKELLEETQRQGEELEVQQEELKQSNEELQEKTDLLQRSEAELKAQQEELQQTNEELEEKANLLEEQKERLENAKMDIETKARELEATSKYKSEFLANMSHELRTPLNSILILSQLLSENKSKVLGEKEIEFSKNIYNSGADLLNLINEILDLSKIESGKMQLDIGETAIREINDDLNSVFSELAKSKNINFKLNTLDSGIQTIVTDKQRLEQILRNLLSNAFKFTSKAGNVTLSISRLDKPILFKNKKLSTASEIVVFEVTDTGIGISPEKQGLIFEAFQQADGSTKRKYGGTGLGLSISRELANALGGEIHLQSELGKGSTFKLYLPLNFDASLITPSERQVEVKEKVEAKERKEPASVEHIMKPALLDGHISTNDDRNQISNTDKVILIMEDDEDFAKIILDFVRERNYRGIIAGQGTTGLSYARYYRPDAIILDMQLPGMNGTEVLKQLKSDPELRHIPVQIISGYDLRKEGMELGAFDFLRKPISSEELKKAFDKIEDFNSKQFKKLLVVEDNETQNKAIRELIGNGDVKSFAAYSGTEAFDMLTKDHFDCVIVDLGLPDMLGFELLEKIKENDALKTVPIIVYTGKDLSKEENSKLMKFANTVVLKTADSQERLLDETMLFLHRVESRLPKEKQHIIRKLHRTEEVLKNKKVLLVDDDIRNIYSLSSVLEDQEMKCITAENGIVSLKVLKENPDVDLILMDVMMPEMDGYDATKEIRRLKEFEKIPIIALTAKAMKGDREKCLEAGMSDYISKPVNIEQLLSLMRVWLYQ